MQPDEGYRPWRESLTEANIHIISAQNPGNFDLTDKWTLLNGLRKALCEREQVSAELCAEIEHELLAREKLMSTGIGEQMAIPHAVIAGACKLMTQCAILPEGIEFESIDGSKAHIVVMLVAPKSALQAHLKVMASIAKVFYRAEARAKVIASKTPAEALAAIMSVADHV
ncbi:PTS sugar transporter subunit IIA [Turneriella parva]|uniref:PTS system IIA component, Fru family n=1 Tax=Turneriella parva (strain ATCC BAA-1111 / DSM 21527 / NCTC 11395 / H) TaxID=869212 RepID=I4B5D2_TURPD|nr:PTS sugar transporter subunit IIA [Turneriella parva]AFM12489.1 PTS system IIA component, Fru family [Turneriella parva DSM 21527]